MKIERPDWLLRPGVQRILAAISDGRFVGGAVRDTLLGRPVADLDLATPATPDEVIARLQAADIQMVPTGLKHGTVTAMADGEAIEITTLRRDVETDGRHAVVAFTDDWQEDAARRDFTMNALYLDADCDIWDPVGGLEDCLAGRVRFVGDPLKRIEEDVLRLLRFYRFQARYGQSAADPTARAACRAMTDRIPTLAAERVRVELFKLLESPDPVPTLELMIEDGVLKDIIPVAADGIARLRALIAVEPIPDAIRRLAALAPDASAERLKLSTKDRVRLAAITAKAPALDPLADDMTQRRLLYRLGKLIYRDRALIEAPHDRLLVLLALAEAWPAPKLPISGSDALALGMNEGERIGDTLATVEQFWIDSDFTASRTECLAKLKEATVSTAYTSLPLCGEGGAPATGGGLAEWPKAQN
jgi:poly(A) polymerase